MDSKELLVPSCDTLSTVASEEQWNQQMFIPTIKQEIVECIDEEDTPYSGDMYPNRPLESLHFVSCDNKDYVMEKVKKELPDDTHYQSNGSMNYNTVSENMGLFKLPNNQTVEIELTEEILPLNIKKETENKNYQIPIKEEILEDQGIIDNAEDTSIHCDVLITPQEFQCKICGIIFKSSVNLLNHNNEHLTVEINVPKDDEVNEFYQCQYCDKGFNNYDIMLAHVSDVHSKKLPKGKLCGKRLKSAPNYNEHVVLSHTQMTSNQVIENSVKCKYCNLSFKNRYRLCKHTKLCRIGKEIKHKCDTCERVYACRRNLTYHIKRAHFDYGRMFACWCGKQLNTPIHLSRHIKRQHDGKMQDRNNDIQCDLCQKLFKTKHYLLKHKKDVHYDYGKVFECWCGKQFRSPKLLYQHKRRQHDGTSNDIINEKVQCDYCQKGFKTKHYLSKHIKDVHYDYGKVFKCWCGKQFRSPKLLHRHMKRPHNGKIKNRNKRQSRT